MRVLSGSGFVLEIKSETFSKKVGAKTYEVARACRCTQYKQRTSFYNQANLPAVLAGKDFTSYRPSFEAQDFALRAVTAFSLNYKRSSPSKGFVISGPVGTGKTHLLVAALSHLTLELGVAARYAEISLLYATIRRGFQAGKSGAEIIEPLAAVEVLAIDELGKGRGSQFELETLDELIARRYNAGKTTLFATNYSLAPERKNSARPVRGYRKTEQAQEGELLRERVGERIYSRLCEMTEFIELPSHTPDHRRTRQELDATSLRSSL